jgi:hypothetical protein
MGRMNMHTEDQQVNFPQLSSRSLVRCATRKIKKEDTVHSTTGEKKSRLLKTQ